MNSKMTCKTATLALYHNPGLPVEASVKPSARSGMVGLALLAGAFLFTGAQALAEDIIQTDLVTLNVETIADGLENPWGVEVLPDGSYLVTERPGRMRIVKDGVVSSPLSGLPRIASSGQGGLLDVALARDFDTSRMIFFSYAAKGSGGLGTAIAKARLSPDATRLQDTEVIFTMNRPSNGGRHFGSRIVVAPDGTLFFTIGDRGEPDRAQNGNDHAGSVLRINPDGSVPGDNPFVDQDGMQPELWSLGHRNPQGADWDEKTATLYTVEHGARGGDEINQPVAGRNYGWPVITYGRAYSGAEIGIGTSAQGFEQPLHYWDPSIAPGGMVVYRGDMFPEWDGDFIVAALKYQLVSRLERDDDDNITDEEWMLKGEYGRIREIRVAPDGALLLLTDESDGALLRVSRADPA